MKGFIQEYGIMMVVVSVVLGMLSFGKTAYAKGIQDAILGSADHIVETGENIVPKEKSSKLITGQEFNNKIPSEATTIVFTNKKVPEGVSTVDLTNAQDGDVVGWLDGTTWKVSTQDSSKAVNFNERSNRMFSDKKNMQEIHFDNIDTSQVTDMNSMFYKCPSLTSLDLSNLDTSNVTNMNAMFESYSSLTSLNLSSFDTSNVKSMNCIFSPCLEETNTMSMFYKCSSLKLIKARSQKDIDNFKTKNAGVNSDTKFEIV